MIPASAWQARAQALRGALLELLLPRACVVCTRLLDAGDTGAVCGRCWVRARQLPYPQCDRCGHPLGARGCTWCDALPPLVRAARSVCWIPGGSAGRIVHAFKYGGWTALARGMAERMARLTWPRDVLEERCALVPVPLARVRHRERGFNQSEVLACALGERWRLPVWTDCLERVRATPTQTRLTPEERRRNVSGAFRAPPGARARLQGTHVMIVDDVLTTGATTVECANALCAGGVRITSIVTFGRAPAAGDRVS
ncbi:MAG TPA: double zinc ribbon domain-containing protein [Gemmatimonadaceae bacterium]|nr:double zinc ribbon domain-containing protein [Gemmatimonadaceae bacterium]